MRAHVDFVRTVEAGRIEVLDAAAHLDSRVAVQDVDPPVPRQSLLDERHDGLGVRHVGGVRLGLVPGIANLACCLLRALGRQIS